MPILLLEENALISSAISQQLAALGLPSSQLVHYKHQERSGLSALLREYQFDAIICQHALDGRRLLQEAHYLGLLKPGCVLLLLDTDASEQGYPPSDLYLPLHLTLPFTAEQLTRTLQHLMTLSGLARALSAPLILREWRIAAALCEDLQLHQPTHRAVAPWLDRLKGHLLLQQQDHLAAAQHYALCTTEYPAWWPRQGLIHALLGLGRPKSARTDLDRNQAHFPPGVRLELILACQLYDSLWQPAWETITALLRCQPHHPLWRQIAILLALLRDDEEGTLEQAHSLNLAGFPEHQSRFSVEAFMLNASLAVWFHYPNAARISALQQEFSFLRSSASLQPHESDLLQALLLGLEYRFDDALHLIARHQPDCARDSHVALLLGAAVCQFCGLPHHAERYLLLLTHYQTRVAPHPLVQQLFKHVVAHLGQRLTQREQRLTQLRHERHHALQIGQYQAALQSSLLLLDEYPALPSDAWQLLEMLQHAWPAGMAAPTVALLVDKLERRLTHSHAFMEQHQEPYQQTLAQVRSHLQPHLQGGAPLHTTTQ